MTHRALPSKPDITRLRKEAKRLYLRLKRQAPQAKLADAQFILAAEYGFKSWGRLKSAIETQAAERWRARLAAQESFCAAAPVAVPVPPRSLQHVWLGQRARLTDDDDAPLPMLETAWLHVGFLLLALLTALGMALR